MTTFYSDHYSADQGKTGHFTTLNARSKIVEVGKKHSRIRRTAAFYTIPAATDMADDDVVLFMDLQSDVRLVELLFSQDANQGATATFNFGLRRNLAGGGAIVDEDLFGAATNLAGAIARTDYFTTGALDNWDRGKPLWDLVNIGLSGSVTVDPQFVYTVAMQATANITVVDGAVETLVEAFYIAGD